VQAPSVVWAHPCLGGGGGGGGGGCPYMGVRLDKGLALPASFFVLYFLHLKEFLWFGKCFGLFLRNINNLPRSQVYSAGFAG
jgi:hypothetical protein